MSNKKSTTRRQQQRRPFDRRKLIVARYRSALEAAECWLTEHGAAYCADVGGVKEPGLAELLAQIRVALGKAVYRVG